MGKVVSLTKILKWGIPSVVGRGADRKHLIDGADLGGSIGTIEMRKEALLSPEVQQISAAT